MIKISGVSKSFNGQVVLADINLEVKENEILVILGESGTGKSVLLKNMMGLLMPDEGSIFIDSQDITKLSERMLLKIRKGIGYLFQEGALYDFMNVFENVAFPLKEHTDLKQKEILDKVQAVLKEMDLEGIERKFPSELSGGMKKRVALARAIILDSKILFCDEPTSGLDPIRSRDISDLIKNVSKRMGCSTVVTSHDIKNAFRIADRVALIHKGTIIAVGTPSDLESSEDKFVREFIL
ncbi:MAG: ATP-binding cassette domain-containing protein [Candidatus Omnitrophica bacterium]|nr:ATP-binding cassette domain-containing protein [Candidatus Omnitrophota bacterium]MBU4333668.1 ATP-binding cassette domain-containing protein [Candidatus Omnitrophota bacterium]